MREITANRQIGSYGEKIKGIITNDIYDCKHNVIGYEVKIGKHDFINILIKNYNINIKEMNIL